MRAGETETLVVGGEVLSGGLSRSHVCASSDIGTGASTMFSLHPRTGSRANVVGARCPHSLRRRFLSKKSASRKQPEKVERRLSCTPSSVEMSRAVLAFAPTQFAPTGDGNRRGRTNERAAQAVRSCQGLGEAAEGLYGWRLPPADRAAFLTVGRRAKRGGETYARSRLPVSADCGGVETSRMRGSP
jgi:hypothetical protein